MKNLVIVESPNKVKTIQKYLGEEYLVEASVGHIAELKKSGKFRLGIDLDTWTPQYTLEKGKKQLIQKLKKLASKSENVYIATDPDREGEAIGDHLVEFLDVKDKYFRIKYNEITKDAIEQAMSNPTKINDPLVNAQKARRMLDRVIGFRLSGLLRTKIANAPTSPSAGRVQSIALKLVIDREKEIQAFIPTDYYKLLALTKDNQEAEYFNSANPDKEKNWIYPEQIEEIKKYFETAKKELEVVDISETQRKVKALTPFKQAALYKRSPFSSGSTQSIAQRLYEGFGDGGLISYPRTDSSRLSQTFINQAHAYIAQKWGKNYISDSIKGFSGDQDAHEAIRPTDVSLTPALAAQKYPEMTDTDIKLYELIYNNTLQALIKQPIRSSKSYTYQNGDYKFRNSFSSVVFDGFYVVTGVEEDAPDPNYQLNQIIPVENFDFSFHQTKPIPRYTDGSLIEALDEIKVGRPSTFASTIKIIKERDYVETEGSSIKPTEFGFNVLEKLINHFSDIINEEYTAHVEAELDQIADSQLEVPTVMTEFWERFTKSLDKAAEEMEKTAMAEIILPEPCPEDEGLLIVRRNKKGQKFVGCKNFPNCKFTRSLNEGELPK
ncbi:type I DNA topoisomerase [Mycoplasma sp. Ms02]|uniref:type I DNA topoisomerase n=1 Tax=Mycoplasma sp. Ms02 TaxID=353851 RepID=UPI001C891F83|nr:type I DNA topoisomerase [Mycoplasma sp. Ms02]QZE12400.1 type I DNA topoisomerase [Mycoplasma sp. Ms02]